MMVSRFVRPSFEQLFAFRRLLPVVDFTPDGERLIFVSNLSGQFNLWSVAVDGGWPEQLTAFTDRAVREVSVSRDGAILFSADKNGDEFGQLFHIPAEGGWPEQLTTSGHVQHTLSASAWARDGGRFVYAANSRAPTDHEVFVWDGYGEARVLFGEGRYASSGAFSPDDEWVLAVDVRSNTDQTIYVLPTDGGDPVELTSHEEDAQFSPVAWTADGSGVYVLTDLRREYLGIALARLNGKTEWVEAPERDIDDAALSADGRVLAWIENVDGWSRLQLRDLSAEREFADPQLPSGVGMALTLSHDGELAALYWGQPGRPAEVYVVEAATGKARAITEHRSAGLKSVSFREPELVSYPSFDGREIPAWLYRPQSDAPSPFVLAIHGGPEAQERPFYRPVYQYLLGRGIGILATNIRGSTGYGKTYQRLIRGDWGGGDLEDWRYAAEWLRAQTFVDGARLGVYGTSYGGFATLTCITRLPDYWAAAVDIVGQSNLVTFVKSVPPSWRRFMAELVGDPVTEEAFLRERSPLTYVDQVRAPLLVIQGAKDPRVVKAESDQMVSRLRELGRTVKYEVFEDDGHVFTHYANELHANRLTCEWLEQHLTV